jgi:tetratricopeptide (TPR) repeat protein
MERTAERFLDALAHHPEGAAHARAERARWLEAEAGPAAAIELLKSRALDLEDPRQEPALRALVEAHVHAQEPDEALRLLERATRARPGAASLHDLRGRTLLALGRNAEATSAFEAALSLDPSHARALAGLGVLAYARGDAAAALGYLERASTADRDDPDIAYRTAQLLLAAKHSAEAEASLRALLLRDPAHAGAANDLAWLAASEGGDLDEALALALRATRISAEPNYVDTLAFVLLRGGEIGAAVEKLEAALELHPAHPTLRYRLGTALLVRGDREEAKAVFRAALASGDFAEADAARERLADLDRGPTPAR